MWVLERIKKGTWEPRYIQNLYPKYLKRFGYLFIFNNNNLFKR